MVFSAVDVAPPDPAGAPRHEDAARANRRGRAIAGPVLPLVVGVALLAVALAQVDRSEPGGHLGLVSVLPVTWWLGVAVVTVGFARSVFSDADRRWWLGAYLVVMVVALHGTPGLVEPHARFPTAWTHVGFVDHVRATGGVDPGYDARYNWPGGFSFGAYLTDLTGADSARALLRLAPVVVNLLLLAPLGLIAGHLTDDRRVRWVGVWLAVVTAWVGQDYLAPQSLAMVCYLAVVAVLLRWFRRTDLPLASAWDMAGRVARRRPRLVGDDRLHLAVRPPGSATPGQQFALVVAVTAIAGVLAFSHQLTPFALVLSATGLVLVGKLERPALPLVLLVCAVGWVAFGTTDFMRDNATSITSGVGDVGGVVSESVDSRIGPDPIRRLVLGVRLGLTTGLLLGAAFGAWRQWRARRADWGLVSLAVAPVPLLGLSSYGGEILLRAALLSLPFLALLAAFGLVREDHDRPPSLARQRLVFGAVALAALPLFVVARYGNEAYERIEGDDLAAWDYLIDEAPAGATVVVPDFAGPWRYEGLTRFDYRVFADEVGGAPEAAAVDALVAGGEGAGYVVLGTATERYRRIAEGLPDGWMDELSDDLVATGHYRTVFESGRTRVLERRDVEPAASPPAAPTTGTGP